MRGGVLASVGFDKIFVHNLFVAARLIYCYVNCLLCMAA
ncbi:hypothetical protein SpAn4DRAFT_4545 [Sporomusa ovata]|uniref:Uncharacterized protein n=1 Tax=Sporomusa ovata TaxID=2378 RepID=A0A0U1L658_9FIRM|nr:hypothetical protein SpAn4DRAFT_4545 [Sporomusa ovata]